MIESRIKEELRQQILRYYRLKEEWCNRLIQSGELVRFKRKELILEQGYHNDYLYLLVDGIWRAWFDTEEREKTMFFAIPGEIFFSSGSYFDSRSSLYSIESSNESMGWKISKREMNSLVDESEEISHWFIHVLGKMMLLTEESYIEMSTSLATDRYRIFARKMPYILQNVPLKEIAAYLGVTPQSLSRIRAEMVKNNFPENDLE